jgi:hypothetical protein
MLVGTFSAPLELVQPQQPFNMVINFGGEASAAIPAPNIAGIYDVWSDVASTSFQTFGPFDNGVTVVLENTASSYFGFSPGASMSGNQTLTGSGQYPNAVIGSWMFVDAGRTGNVRISGLNNSKTYTVKVGGFRPNTATFRSTTFTIGVTNITRTSNWSGTDNQADNDSQFAIFTGVAPSGGGILLSLVTNGTTFGYLTVIEITEE